MTTAEKATETAETSESRYAGKSRDSNIREANNTNSSEVKNRRDAGNIRNTSENIRN
jgi:hypothetical protein